MQQTETIRIQAYSFADVFKELEPYLKDEFLFDFETNEGYPQHIGTVYSVGLTKRHLSVTPSNKSFEPAVELETYDTSPTTQQDKPKTRRALSAANKLES